MLRIIACITFVCCTLLGVAQTNQTDGQGRKQGKWIVKYTGLDVVRYEGSFVDNKPNGKFKYYFPNGKQKAIVTYYKNGTVSYALLYHESGQPMAEGKYIGQIKDSVWVYYDAGGRKSAEENYVKGKKNGTAKVFFDDGSLAEVSNWEMDLQQGDMMAYYENGQVRIKAFYKDGNFDGEYVKYYKSGKTLAKGKFANAVKTGQWTFYHSNGSIDYKELWKDGKLVRQVKENGAVTEYYESERKKAEYTFRAGKKHGEFVEFNDNGEWKTEFRQGDPNQDEPDEYVRRLEGQTLKRKGNYNNGVLNGKVVYYNIAGIKVKEEVYENGTLVSTKEF